MATNRNENQPSTSSGITTKEIIVRVPKNTKKRFSLMRFNESLRVDITSWKNFQVKMQREDNRDVTTTEVEWGADTEFQIPEVEEYNPDKQPWLLTINGRKYRGFREGQFNQNASYYIFMQAPDGAFDAYPIVEWYQCFVIGPGEKLNIEDAEELFLRRKKIRNFFALKCSIKKKQNDDEVYDLDSEDETPNKEKLKSTAKKDVKGGKDKAKEKRKLKKKRVKVTGSDDDEEVYDESEDDEECEYMIQDSDSGEDENEDNPRDECKGVEDMDAIRGMINSDSENEDEENEGKSEIAKNDNLDNQETQLKMNFYSENTPNLKRKVEANTEEVSFSPTKKQKSDVSDGRPEPKPSTSNSVYGFQNVDQQDELTDTNVRSYLLQKPMTTDELLSIFKHTPGCSQKQIVTRLANILKSLKPQRVTIGGKLHLFINEK